MAIPHLNDSILENVSITWDNGPSLFLTQVQAKISDAEQQRIVRGFFTIGAWDDALFMAEGVKARESRSMDLRAFAYPLSNLKPAAPDYALLVFEGVNICDGAFEYINLSERAFTRLMAQLLDVLVSGATRDKLAVIYEDWWAHFVAVTADIQKRVQHG